MRRGWLDSEEEKVSHIWVAEPTAAWMVLVTLMKTSRMTVVCPVMANQGIWLENLNVWALVFGVRLVSLGY